MLRTLYCLIVVAFLTKCVTTNSEIEVIERNKETPPAWAQHYSQPKLITEDNRHSLIHMSLHKHPINIAIKDSQIFALEETEGQLISQLSNQLVKHAQQEGIHLTSHSLLQDLLSKSVKENPFNLLQIDDIYYEQIQIIGEPSQSDAPYRYRVYIRVIIPDKKLNDFKLWLAEQLIKSPQNDLRQLGKSLKVQILHLLSH